MTELTEEHAAEIEQMSKHPRYGWTLGIAVGVANHIHGVAVGAPYCESWRLLQDLDAWWCGHGVMLSNRIIQHSVGTYRN